MPKCFKLTDENMRTHDNFQWTIGEWKSAPGKGAICTSGWIHCYDGAELALIMNSIHANFSSPRLFSAEYDGLTLDDKGCKRGVQRLRVLDEITDLSISNEQRCELALVCALMVYHAPSFVMWTERWIFNIDRSYAVANAVAYAAYRAAHAAYAAAYAVYAAANAAYAAYRAAYAAEAYAADATYAANAAAYAVYAAAYAANAAKGDITFTLSEIAHDIIAGRSR